MPWKKMLAVVTGGIEESLLLRIEYLIEENRVLRNQQKEVLWATDFFTSEVWTCAGLTTFYVLFFIQLSTRKVILGGITTSPNGEWMKQVARNVCGWDGEMTGARYLIHDRDSKYTEAFDEILRAVGIEPVKLPARSPNLNAYAERFVKSIKTESIEKMILFGEKSLRHVIKEYLAHYHSERNHQGINNVIPYPDERLGLAAGKVTKSERLGGLLNYYHRSAA